MNVSTGTGTYDLFDAEYYFTHEEPHDGVTQWRIRSGRQTISPMETEAFIRLRSYNKRKRASCELNHDDKTNRWE